MLPLLLLFLAVAVMLPSSGGADELTTLTAQVLSARVAPTALGRMLAPDAVQRAAERRQDLMAHLITTQPGRVPNAAISPSDRARLPGNVRAFVETWDEISGVASFVPWVPGSGPMRYQLLLDSQRSASDVTLIGGTLTLYAPSRLFALREGYVRACGVRVGKMLAMADCRPVEQATRATVAALPGFVDVPIQITATNTAPPNLAALTTVVYRLAAPEPPPGPPAPTGLGFTPEVSWAPGAADLTGYVVERAPSAAGEYLPLATLPATDTRYVDASGVTGTPCYRVRAVNADGPSLPSDVAVCFAAAAAPPPVNVSDVTQSFTRGKDVKPPALYAVSAPPYVCSRTVGGTSQLVIASAAPGGTPAVLKTVNIPNPPIGGTFSLRCQVTATAVNVYLDGALRASVVIAAPAQRRRL